MPPTPRENPASFQAFTPPCNAEEYRVYSLEIVYSYFERTIELPESPESAEVELDYCDGMLLISLTTNR